MPLGTIPETSSTGPVAKGYVYACVQEEKRESERVQQQHRSRGDALNTLALPKWPYAAVADRRAMRPKNVVKIHNTWYYVITRVEMVPPTMLPRVKLIPSNAAAPRMPVPVRPVHYAPPVDGQGKVHPSCMSSSSLYILLSCHIC